MGFLLYIIAFIGVLIWWGKKNNIPIKNKGIVYLEVDYLRRMHNKEGEKLSEYTYKE